MKRDKTLSKKVPIALLTVLTIKSTKSQSMMKRAPVMAFYQLKTKDSLFLSKKDQCQAMKEINFPKKSLIQIKRVKNLRKRQLIVIIRSTISLKKQRIRIMTFFRNTRVNS